MSSIDYGFGTMANRNSETGIRYGVIYLNSLNSDLAQDLMFGPDVVDLWYEDACAEVKKEAAEKFETLRDEASIAASEVDALMSDQDREEFIERWFENAGYETDLESFVDRELEAFSDTYESDEGEYQGECDGVKYLITYLGGAPLLTVTEGPRGYARQLCSPCVPGAADLDGGFELSRGPFYLMNEGVSIGTFEDIEQARRAQAKLPRAGNWIEDDHGEVVDGSYPKYEYECYCVPRDWLADDGFTVTLPLGL